MQLISTWKAIKVALPLTKPQLVPEVYLATMWYHYLGSFTDDLDTLQPAVYHSGMQTNRITWDHLAAGF